MKYPNPIFLLVLTLIFLLPLSGCAQEPTLAESLKDASLEVETLRDLTESELPPGASSGQQFAIPTHCNDCGGKILIFGNETDAGRMADIWREMGQHVYTNGGVLLQVNGTIDGKVARQYGDVLLERDEE